MTFFPHKTKIYISFIPLPMHSSNSNEIANYFPTVFLTGQVCEDGGHVERDLQLGEVDQPEERRRVQQDDEEPPQVLEGKGRRV